MTDRTLPENGKSMYVRVWFEVGHTCEPRQSSIGRALALDWRVWVQGRSGVDISAFVHKVVFYLRPPEAFVYPKRVIEEPPYEIQESGCGSIEIPIHVYLKYSEKPKKIRLKYSIKEKNNLEKITRLRSVFYDLENPTTLLCKILMKSGGEIIAHAHNERKTDGVDDLVVELSDKEYREKLKKVMKVKKYKFIEPVHYTKLVKKVPKAIEERVALRPESQNVDFHKLLKPLAMTNDEINRVSHLYWSYTSYEKSMEALNLPPFTDSVYKVPDLPFRLKSAIKSDKLDHCLS